ncbi:hypothetical protein BDZ89DRAFT_1139163 [Hymenopellis radicata]|nr:hypothetical protein BDZ89DRAFT_1139163 [Hymenopellis radicata]
MSNDSIAGYIPAPNLVIEACKDAKKFDLLFRPRVEVPFYRVQHSQYIESMAVVTVVLAPGWRPHVVSKTTWVAFKYLFDYRVLTERTGVNHRHLGSQQVEFYAWRLLVHWEDYLRPGPAKIKIGETIQRMRQVNVDGADKSNHRDPQALTTIVRCVARPSQQ